MTLSRILAAALPFTMAACIWGDNPVGPSAPGGTITATIGSAPFAGTVTPGGAVNSRGILTVGGTSADETTTIIVTVTAEARTTTIGGAFNIPGTVVLQTSGSAGSGLWSASVAGGNGSVTVSTLSPTTATGNFSATLVPTAGSGAVGNRTVNGTFSVTF